MGTIFHSDNSGVLSLLIGLIALVMFGVLVTLLMDGSLSLPGGRGDPAAAVEAQSARILELETQRKLLEVQRERRDAHAKQAGRLAELRDRLEAAGVRLREAHLGVQAEQRELEAVRREFAEYQDHFRRELWRSAVGTDLGALTTRLQRRYAGVRIKSLNAVEMAIDHDGGSGRIPVAELPDHLLEKYQLDVQEAARILREEEERKAEQMRLLAQRREEARRVEEAERRRLDDERRRAGQPTEEELARRNEKHEQIAALQLEIDAMYEGLRRLERETQEARGKIGGRDRSPPGSLETWEQRYNRLAARREQARILLRAAEDRMRELDPDYRRRPDLPVAR